MAVITNYATLQTAVGDYLARSDLTSWLPNFVQNWEERFYRDSKNWASWMESALNVAISGGVAAVPAGYLGLKIAYISGQTSLPLKRVSLAQLYARYPRSGGSGTAAYIARNAGNFEFGPIAEDGTLVGTYYVKQTNLRTDSDGSNWLTLNAPDLALYGALLEAEPFLKNDARIEVWRVFYADALAAYRSQFKEEEYLAPMTVVV